MELQLKRISQSIDDINTKNVLNLQTELYITPRNLTKFKPVILHKCIYCDLDLKKLILIHTTKYLNM